MPDTFPPSVAHVRIELFIGLHSAGADNGPNIVAARELDALNIVRDQFDAFSASRIVGYWRGGSEESLHVVAIVPDSPLARDRAVETARAAAASLRQECVAVAFGPVAFTLVSPDARDSDKARAAADYGGTIDRYR